MKIQKSNKLLFTLGIPLGITFALILSWQWFFASNRPLVQKAPKQKGAHVFGIMDTTDFNPFKENNIEWITLVPWGFQDHHESPEISHRGKDSLMARKYDSTWVSRISLVRNAGFKVFVKPHIWIDNTFNGKWRSDIFPTSQEHWEIWSSGYRDFILRYAGIAEKAGAELFCIGTELSRLSVEKPAFWRKLILDVREIYSGEITYAANWNKEFEAVEFWDQLDYIGIQAYFPLVKVNYPSTEQLMAGWENHIPKLEGVHKRFNRDILFTEMGYKSTANGGVRPWEWAEEPAAKANRFSAETQANSYRAFFNSVWGRDWFAGVHLWQMRTDYTLYEEALQLDFTPQGKPAEAVITRGFSSL